MAKNQTINFLDSKKKGDFYFNQISANGNELQRASETYTRRESAIDAFISAATAIKEGRLQFTGLSKKTENKIRAKLKMKLI